MAKTLIFGGAFDPPHSEHIAVCKAAMKELGIDRLVIVPTFYPPHKKAGFLSYEERCRLCLHAFEGCNVSIDTIEKDRGENNYSAYVLPLLKEKYGDIVYLIGGDSIEHFDTWFKPDVVANVCPIAVVGRDGYADSLKKVNEVKAKFGGEFILLSAKGKSVSSSMIRARLLLGEKVDCLPPAVQSEIERSGMFDKYKPMVEKLHGYQSEDLFEHSKAVVKSAIYFNSRHNLKQDFDRVFLAALLHDNAKQRPSVDGLDVPDDAIGTPVLHQFLGAEKARRDFGIDDEGILDAIRYHTTARPDMSVLEKLIYTADSLSEDRMYDPIPTLRKIAFDDFEKGFLATLKFTYDKLKGKGGKIYPLTLAAYQYYTE